VLSLHELSEFSVLSYHHHNHKSDNLQIFPLKSFPFGKLIKMVVTAHPQKQLLTSSENVDTLLICPPKVILSTHVKNESTCQNKSGEEAVFKTQELPGKGVGMIAMKKFYPGDLILAEKPLIRVPDAIFENPDECEEFLEKKMNSLSSSDRELFLGLTDKRVVEEDDSFDPHPYTGIFYTNAMSYDDDAVLCPVMARANHSCRANAEFISRTDLGEQHLVANYIINEGEEITINYMSMVEEGSDIRESRQSYLRESYGFQCCCVACTLQDTKLEEDEIARECIKELQAVGENKLDVHEIESLINKIYQIEGKHSYILHLFDILYKTAKVGSYRMVQCAVNGFTIAVNLYGGGSKEANDWKTRLHLQKSIYFLILFNETLQEA